MRLVDADRALKIVESYRTTHGTTLGRHSGVADIIYEALEKLPVIDAEPVRHGEWIESRSSNGTPLCECSICRDSALSQDNAWGDPIEYYTTDFCPNCGAKMDESESST